MEDMKTVSGVENHKLTQRKIKILFSLLRHLVICTMHWQQAGTDTK